METVDLGQLEGQQHQTAIAMSKTPCRTPVSRRFRLANRSLGEAVEMVSDTHFGSPAADAPSAGAQCANAAR
jgi:hypothetical protein